VAYGVDALSTYLTATVFENSLLESSPAQTGQTVEEYFGQVRDYFGSLPVDRFPNIVAMVEPLMRDVGDERFEFGLDLLVGGLARYARPRGTDAAAQGQEDAQA
jgi:hypothetical protein